MTLETILNEVVTKRPELSRQEARAVATDILYSGEEASVVLASKPTIDKLISGYKTRQSNQLSVAANDPTTCPVCKIPLKPIKLTDDRPAVYCSKHFVVFPIRPEGQK
jgi:hypothetical protein